MNCRFGISATTLDGTAEIYFPYNENSFKVNMNIVLEHVPLLLSFADMDRLGIFFKFIEDRKTISYRNWRFYESGSFSRVSTSLLESSHTVLFTEKKHRGFTAVLAIQKRKSSHLTGSQRAEKFRRENA